MAGGIRRAEIFARLEHIPLHFISRNAHTWEDPVSGPDLAKIWKNRIGQPFVDMAWLDGGLTTDSENLETFHISQHYGIAECVPLLMAKIKKTNSMLGDPASHYFPGRPICDSFIDDQVMENAIAYLSDCVEGRHEKCVAAEKPQLPTRVLDVHASFGSIVHLRATDVNDRNRYAALSYCWGGSQPLTATQTNISELMAGIEIVKLPQTLQDAVHVTRRLGIRYLWIDALCIIQDSDMDKQTEIEKMGSIYRNAMVTLAAAYSRTASDGFLSVSRDYKPTSSCTLPVHLPIKPYIGNVSLAPQIQYSRELPSPLRTRGWAFQEAILSQRLLIFSKYDLRCHCRVEHGRSLNLGNLKGYYEPNLYNLGYRDYELLESQLSKYGQNWMQAPFLGRMWESMLADFTLRALTVPDDRPRAVQGIANELLQSRHLSHDIDKTYVAGTWMACLPDQLLWCRFVFPHLSPDGHGPKPCPSPVLSRSSRAPSWSWVSLDCPILFKTSGSEQAYDGFSLIRVLSCPSSPGGNSSGIVLEIECDVLCRSKEEFDDDLSKSKGVYLMIDLDTEEVPPQTTCVYYVQLAKQVRSDRQRDDDPPFLYYISGIVTHKASCGSFKRVGYFKWNVGKPLSEGFSFGQRMTLKLG